jgi:hypothetical protein
MAEIQSEKKCTRCFRLRPIEEFSSHRGHRDGLSNYCKSCRRQLRRTLEVRNNQRQRSRWADGIFKSLHLNGRDY